MRTSSGLALLAVSSLAVGAAGDCASLSDQAFTAFLQQFGKSYSSPTEWTARCRLFTSAAADIADYTMKNPKASFKLAPNYYSDATPAELQALTQGSDLTVTTAEILPTPTSTPAPTPVVQAGSPARRLATTPSPTAATTTLPTSVDYRSTSNPKGVVAVSAVRDQGGCFT
jgi:hypothetical protein